MRVITGSARGRKLRTPSGGEIVRPTTDKVKEAMFSIVQFELENAVVLDAFAGSGQLGIEALSRGARQAYFTEENKTAFEVVQSNLQTTGLYERATLLQTDVFSFLARTEECFDIVFSDPPYEKGLTERILPLLSARCRAGALVMCETAAAEELPASVGELQKLREYKYGKTKLTTYRKSEGSI